jgi:hypothetical protein
VAQRQNALGIPHAMFKRPLTLDEYMGARVIADPIHLFDCVMPCAGGDGVLVMSEARARDLGLPFVRVLAATERHNAWREDPIMVRGGWSVDRDELYAMAGIQPKDLDFVQFYDDYPVIVMMQYEGHGLCAEGEGAEFVRAHTLDCEGTMPTNTSGGQLSMGRRGRRGFLGPGDRAPADRQAFGQGGAQREYRLVSGRHDHYDRCRDRCLIWGYLRSLRCVQRGARGAVRVSGPHRGPHGRRASCPSLPTRRMVQQTANGPAPANPHPRLPPLSVATWHATVVAVWRWPPAGAGPIRGTLAHGRFGGGDEVAARNRPASVGRRTRVTRAAAADCMEAQHHAPDVPQAQEPACARGCCRRRRDNEAAWHWHDGSSAEGRFELPTKTAVAVPAARGLPCLLVAAAEVDRTRRRG